VIVGCHLAESCYVTHRTLPVLDLIIKQLLLLVVVVVLVLVVVVSQPKWAYTCSRSTVHAAVPQAAAAACCFAPWDGQPSAVAQQV
jgi:hypothetical protein